MHRAAGAGWERPRKRQKGRQKPPASGPSMRRMEGGRSQPRTPRKRGDRGRRWLPEGQRGLGLSRTAESAGSGNSSGKRWVLSFCRTVSTPKPAQRAAKAVLGRSRRDGQFLDGLVDVAGEQGQEGQVVEADTGAAPAVLRAVEARPGALPEDRSAGGSTSTDRPSLRDRFAPLARAGSDPGPRINWRMERRASGP